MRLLFFKAPWCHACHTIESKAPSYAEHIDCSEQEEVAIKYNISSLPCFIATNDDGSEIGRILTTDMGALAKWYEALNGED